MPERSLSVEELDLLSKSIHATRSRPTEFARGSQMIEDACTVEVVRKRRLAELAHNVRQLRREGVRPRDNKLVMEDARLCAALRARVLGPTERFTRPPYEAIRMTWYFESSMRRVEAEALVLIAVRYYDDNPAPNPAMPACFRLPGPTDLSEEDLFKLKCISVLQRNEVAISLSQKLVWAWKRLETWGDISAPSPEPPRLSRRARRIVILLTERSSGDLIIGPDLAAIYQKRWIDDTGLNDGTLTGAVLDEIREHFQIINVKKKGYAFPSDSPARQFRYRDD